MYYFIGSLVEITYPFLVNQTATISDQATLACSIYVHRCGHAIHGCRHSTDGSVRHHSRRRLPVCSQEP